ncbi:MAG: ATP-dependent helicase HrpB [Pseudomonadota bacterium]
MADPLPIDDVLPELLSALKAQRRAVLQAPPGAGKTTRVPLALLKGGFVSGKIIMLEPRRLAARAAAKRMAETLGQKTGQTVGYRIRGEAKTGSETRIEVVTEGILTRMVQAEPDLPGIGAVIFDEFHERSLNADLGLALCLEVADALRDDLLLLAMSATLDAAPVAHVMAAPIITAEGRSFPVEDIYLAKPGQKNVRFENAIADLILRALSERGGSLLAFLPGEGEIRRTAALLGSQVDADTEIAQLFGAMDFKAQQKAIRPAQAGRKVVLATSIAETSLTIPDIQIVVDGGKARRALFDPNSGMQRLVTQRVTRAEATQRAGRAGRVEEGACYKLWTRGENGALSLYPEPEIVVGDLSSLALELAAWGASETDLHFVTPPHAGRLSEARSLLQLLGALSSSGQITDHGKALAKMPVHPRLGHLLGRGGRQSALLAALLSDRDPMRDAGPDLSLRIRALQETGRHDGALQESAARRIRQEAKRLARLSQDKPTLDLAGQAALAYPDRVGLRREGEAPRYLLANGRGATFESNSPIATRLIVATDLDAGRGGDARIRQAVSLDEGTFRALFADQIAWQNLCVWSKREGQVLSRRQERFGALVLEDRRWKDAPEEAVATAMLDGVRQLGLPLSVAAKRLMARTARMSAPFPNLREPHLMETLEQWLLPHLGAVRTVEAWKSFDVVPALTAILSWEDQRRLEAEVPGHFVTPLGRKIAIDYSGAHPAIALRLQEMFGVTQHPQIRGDAIQVTLLSPAGRPVQVTTDLPGFWATSYDDVRKDMRGRYPKHPWPEDPMESDPTLRTKRRS